MDKIAFSPVETFLLISNGKAELKDLFKLITLDLILANVLKTNKVKARPAPQSPVFVTYNYIGRGSQFSSYKRLPYQESAFSIFENIEGQYQLFQYVKLLSEFEYSVRGLKKKIVQSPRLAGLVKSTWFTSFSITDKGEKIAAELRQTIEKATVVLCSPTASSVDKINYASILGNNVLLIENLTLVELKNIITSSVSELSRRDVDDYSTDFSSFWAIDTFQKRGSDFEDFSFETSFDSFESSADWSSCSSDSTSSDSGSSCSSCSSCSGD